MYYFTNSNLNFFYKYKNILSLYATLFLHEMKRTLMYKKNITIQKKPIYEKN